MSFQWVLKKSVCSNQALAHSSFALRLKRLSKKAELKAWEAQGRIKNYRKNEPIFAEQENSRGRYIILKGEVSLFLMGTVAKRELIMRVRKTADVLSGNTTQEQRH